MKADFGTSRGGQLSSANEQVLSLEFHARSTNVSPAYAGLSDVGPDNGRELVPGEVCTVNFAQEEMDAHAGRDLFLNFYVAVGTAGDKVDWVVILK